MTTVLDADYFRSLRKPEPEPEQAYPAPEHTSRDPWPEGFTTPGPVLQLRKLAETEGWSVRLQYSRGRMPHAGTGRPGALVHTVALQAFHPETRSRLVALYVVPVENPAGKKWDGVLISSPKIPPYAGCSITDGKAFLQARGRVLPSWLDAIRARNAAKVKSPSRSTSKRRESGG